MIRVGVIGAFGRMGSAACEAIDEDSELDLVCRIGRDDSLDLLTENAAEVAVELTTPASVAGNVEFCIERGINVVVGATGLNPEDLAGFRDRAMRSGSRVFVVPNFALGAVLMMDFARRAAPFFSHAEITERHHEKKLDAPSGTALRTAQLISNASGAAGEEGAVEDAGDHSRGRSVNGIRIHSLRLPGSVAHQEVVFGGTGETLTIRHDSIDRASFMPGLLLAIKKVGSVAGVAVGLEHVLEL